MSYLLDTQALIWYFENDRRLSVKGKNVIEDASNTIHVSYVSLWEIAIKVSIGKLKINKSHQALLAAIEKQKFPLVNLSSSAISRLYTLPFHHKDPFDRLIISQADTAGFTLISNDGPFEDYAIPVVW